MLTLLTNEQFTRAYALVMRSVERKTPIDPETLSREDEELIMAMLSMLEYISINFLANTIDRAMIFGKGNQVCSGCSIRFPNISVGSAKHGIVQTCTGRSRLS